MPVFMNRLVLFVLGFENGRYEIYSDVISLLTEQRSKNLTVSCAQRNDEPDLGLDQHVFLTLEILS